METDIVLTLQSSSLEVANWLQSVAELSQYAERFLENDINGQALHNLLPQLSHYLGIKNGYHWEKIRQKGKAVKAMDETKMFQKKDIPLYLTSSVEEVSSWLRDIPQLEQYAISFKNNDIDGQGLKHLTFELLKKLGVKKIGHWNDLSKRKQHQRSSIKQLFSQHGGSTSMVEISETRKIR